MQGTPNRFVRAIRSGEIDSVEDLKAAFRELALATHPDLARPGPGVEAGAARRETWAAADPGEAFIAVRAEYEAALANFERHRFGASRASASSPRRGASVDSGQLWGCLSLMLKRGFPKEARHEKEILRYEYARWRLRGALDALWREKGSPEPLGGDTPSKLFDAFEDCLLGLKKAEPALLVSTLAYLGELCDYASRRLPAMRVALVLSFDGLRSDSRLLPKARDFLILLSSELGIGPSLGA